MSDRDKRLIGVMGWKRKTISPVGATCDCQKHSCWFDEKDRMNSSLPNFSTWEGFGKLKAYMLSRDDVDVFFDNYLDSIVNEGQSVADSFAGISPEGFADFADKHLQAVFKG